MKEEDYIKTKCGKENPFKVPDGYFEDFTQNLIRQLPEENTPRISLSVSLWKHVRMATSIAAAIVILMTGTYVVINNNQFSSKNRDMAEELNRGESHNDEYVDEALDYAMVNNYEIYQYLTENAE